MTSTKKLESNEIPPLESAEAFRAPTIREAALTLLCYVDGTGEDGRTLGLSYINILAYLKVLFPKSNTSTACLRWYAVKIRGEEYGYENCRLVQRRPRSLPVKNKETT